MTPADCWTTAHSPNTTIVLPWGTLIAGVDGVGLPAQILV